MTLPLVEDPDPEPPATGPDATPTCAGLDLVLDDAVLRSWTDDGDVVTLSLLVRSDVRGFRTIRLRYLGARVVGRDGTALPGIPLQPGRTYVLSGEDRIYGGAVCEHRLRFFPAPEFGIAFDDFEIES